MHCALEDDGARMMTFGPHAIHVVDEIGVSALVIFYERGSAVVRANRPVYETSFYNRDLDATGLCNRNRKWLGSRLRGCRKAVKAVEGWPSLVSSVRLASRSVGFCGVRSVLTHRQPRIPRTQGSRGQSFLGHALGHAEAVCRKSLIVP